MQAQISKPNDDLINQQFDKKIISDQLRKVEKVSAILPKAVVFQCSNSIPAYSPKMNLGSDRVLKSLLENPAYSEGSKIQFIKDALRATDNIKCINTVHRMPVIEHCCFYNSFITGIYTMAHSLFWF